MVSREIADRIAAQPVRHRPFPYLVADDVLPSHVLEGMRRFWPAADHFIKDTKGNSTCDPRKLASDDSEASLFWSEFARDVAPAIARASLGQFAEWILARYGPEARKFGAAKFRLMQAEPSYGGVPYHAHHWHSPLWCVTVLLYVDEAAGGQQGTTLHALESSSGEPSLEAASSFAARSLHGNRRRVPTWDGSGLVEAFTANYTGNRLIAFLDSPISYHSVKPVETVGQGTRRVFRVHLVIRQSELLYQLLYGVTEKEYVARREQGADDPDVIAWLRRDIAQVWAEPQSLPARVRQQWSAALKISF